MWRVLPFTDDYEASDDGFIRSVDRYDKTGRFRRGVVLKQHINNRTQYPMVAICIDGKRKMFTVHTLVALTYPEICGIKLNGYEVLHLDGIRNNNNAHNLKWGSHTENMNDTQFKERSALSHKGQKAWNKGLKFSDDVKKRFSECQKGKTYINKRKKIAAIKNGVVIKIYDSIMIAAKDVCGNQSNIVACLKGRYSTSYGYTWKYVN